MPKGQGIFLEFLPSKLIAPTPTQPTTTTVFSECTFINQSRQVFTGQVN